MSPKLLSVYTVRSKFIPQGFALDLVTNDGNAECKIKNQQNHKQNITKQNTTKQNPTTLNKGRILQIPF